MKDKLEYPNDGILEEIRFEEKHREQVLDTINNSNAHTEIKLRNRYKSRIAYSTIGAILLFAFFVGSSYFSPNMAKVVAKIPYFAVFIQQEEYKHALYDVMSDVISKHNYNVKTIDASVPKREIFLILIGTKKEVSEIKDEVKDNIQAALIDNNFGKFDIQLMEDKNQEQDVDYEVSEKVKQYIKDTQELEEKIVTLLEKEKYVTAFPVSVQINDKQKSIYVAVPKTETRTEELEDLLRTVSKDYGEFTLHISKIDMEAREQELRWGKAGIINIISSGLLENESFKVTGFSYSFHPLPLQIKVKTSVKSSDHDAQELAERIENEIHEFIKTHERTKELRNDPYEVKVYSKDRKQIN